ncbi:MAG: nuclear transport factor 2 family protein [Mesorhizobium sp.]|nr:MAG: nuclear transport factor 2 family protein [Mesorhizobium sp.]
MTTKNAPYSLERLADRAAIYDVMCRYCRGVDRLDFETLRSAYHPDATDNHGPYNGDVDGFIDWVRNRHQKIPFSKHLLGNMIIEFTRPDEAAVETYCIAVQRYPADARASLTALLGDGAGGESNAVDLFVYSRYVDKVTRREGVWRIQERNVVLDSTALINAPSAQSNTVAQQIYGRHDKHDFLYEFRTRLGL